MKISYSGIVTLFALGIGLACTKAPKTENPPNLFDGTASKSEFDQQGSFALDSTGNLASMDGSSSMALNLIRIAMEKEAEMTKTRNGLNLLSKQDSKFALIQPTDQFKFKIYQDALRMYFAHDINFQSPVAEWKIDAHCRVERKLTDRGEKTRYNELKCDDGANFTEYDTIKFNWQAVQVRTIPTGYDALVSKEEIVESETRFKIKTTKNIDGNIGASKIWNPQDKKWHIYGSSLSAARELIMPDGFVDFNILFPVNFTSDVDRRYFDFNSDVLADIELLAEENKEYTMRLKLTESYLLVQKLVPATGVASTERTYAEQVGDLYAVTVAGYPIGKYKLDNEIVNGVRTVKIEAIAVKTLEDATMVYIDRDKVEKFKSAEEKIDTFAADLLADGSEWYYEKTIVDRPLDSESSSLPFEFELGAQWESGRLRVHRTKNSIQLVDVNIPPEAGPNVSGDQMSTKLEIPARWVDYRVITTGKSAGMVEEKLVDGHPAANIWDKRKWVNFEFNRADNLADSRTDSYKLNKLEVTPDYVGFEVFESDKHYGGIKAQATFKYSLYRAKPSIEKGRTYYASDRKDFGFFAQVQQTLGGTTKAYEDVSEKRVNVSRMYPAKDERNGGKPTIWFYITNNSPDDPYIQEATQEAVDAWDRTFHKAAEGSGKEPISVKLSPERVELGDVRYNKVAYYGYDRASALLGYGPSVADPRTGEIHIATNHIYLRNYREGIWRSLAQYVRYQLNQYTGNEPTGLVRFNPETGKYESLIPNQILTDTYINGIDAGNVDGSSIASLAAGAGQGFISKDMLEFYGIKPGMQVHDSKIFSTPIHALLMDHNGALKQSLYDAIDNELDKGRTVNTAQLMSRLQPTTFDYLDLNQYRNRLHGNVPAFLEGPSLKNNPKKNWVSLAANQCDYGYVAANANTIRNIEKYCDNPESGILFKKYMDELRSLNRSATSGSEIITHTEMEEAAFTSCSNILLKQKMVATLVHEFGHNFGLRHNFAGSTDVTNFPIDETTGKAKFMTASSMDYLGNDDDRGYEPGPYDIAAIRYGYYDAVEVKDAKNVAGQSTTIIPLNGRSIEKAVKADGEGKILKPYAYCTDHEILSGAGQMPLTDPNCRKWDRGTNPIEITKDLIDFYYAYMMTSMHRFDKAGLATSSSTANYLLDKVFIPLKVYHDYYRFKLNEAMGDSDRYLANSTAEQVRDFVYASKNQELIDLHEAAQMNFKFLKAVVFSPASYCKVDLTSGKSQFFEFELARQAINAKSIKEDGVGFTMNLCSEDKAKNYFASEMGLSDTQAIEKVSLIGNLFNDLRYSPIAQEFNDRANIQVGISEVRKAALSTLTVRGTTSGMAADIGFTPNYLDLDSNRKELMAAIADRTLLGESQSLLLESSEMEKDLWDNNFAQLKMEATVAPSSPDIENKFLTMVDKNFINSFKKEWNLLSSIYSDSRRQSPAPGVSNDRIGAFSAFRVPNNVLTSWAQQMLKKPVTDALGELRSSGYNYIPVVGTYFLANQKDNPTVFALIRKFDQLNEELDALANPAFVDEAGIVNVESKLEALIQEVNVKANELIQAALTERQAPQSGQKLGFLAQVAKAQNAVAAEQETASQAPTLTADELAEIYVKALESVLISWVRPEAEEEPKLDIGAVSFLFNLIADNLDAYMVENQGLSVQALMPDFSASARDMLAFYKNRVYQKGELEAQVELLYNIVTTNAI